jgi:hypothetical protein
MSTNALCSAQRWLEFVMFAGGRELRSLDSTQVFFHFILKYCIIELR